MMAPLPQAHALKQLRDPCFLGWAHPPHQTGRHQDISVSIELGNQVIRLKNHTEIPTTTGREFGETKLMSGLGAPPQFAGL